jgi:membrane protein DedA with SNARE-associated domain
MLDWIVGLVRGMGAPGVGLLMFLENVFPPIPSEVIMPLAGFVAAQGGLNFWAAVAAGALGSLAGAAGWYWVGRAVGERRLRAWVDRHGRWLTLSCEDVDTAKRWFERHGGVAVFGGRLVPGVRTLISVPAGFAAMPLVPFLLYSAAGTALWTLALAVAGRALGTQYDRVSQLLEPAGMVVLGVIAAAYLVRVVRWRRGPAAGDA